MSRPINSFSQARSEFDRVWLELAELRQSLNARPIAPTPDYRSDLPADEPCSCEESERLKAELGEAHIEIARWKQEFRVTENARESFEMAFNRAREKRAAERADEKAWRGECRKQLAAANALLTEVHDDPRQQRSYWWRKVEAHLSSQPAAPSVTDAE